MRLAERPIWPVVANCAPDFGEMLSDPDARKAQRVMEVILQMGKLDIATLQEAYDRED